MKTEINEQNFPPKKLKGKKELNKLISILYQKLIYIIVNMA